MANSPTSPSSLGDTSKQPGPAPPLAHHATDLGQRYGRADHLVFHTEGPEDEVTRIRHLFKRPIVRQWIEDGKLFREANPREVPRVELFFDLLYVGIIHQLAEAAVEEAGGLAVARFILTFYPSWSIWEEARRFSNVSGSDDMMHRLWVLCGMACMLGYSVSASAIELHPEGEEGFDSRPVHCAAAFWLIIKLTRVLVLWYYALRIPQFRLPQFLTGCATMVPMFVYLPLIWVKSRSAQIALATVGIVVDLVRVDVLFFLIASKYRGWRDHRHNMARVAAGEMSIDDVKPFTWNFTRMGNIYFRVPAVNIEHSLDRSGAFVVIVLGEMVMNFLYVAGRDGTGFGASLTYGKAVMGLMIAWALNYLYMIPGEEINNYEHPLRRAWLTGVLFSFFHWPLVASLVLASSAAKELLMNEEAHAAVAWYWGCGLGFAILFMTGIDMLHRNLGAWNSQRVPRAIRYVFNLIGALALILVPLAWDQLSTTDMFGIAVGITWAILIVNVVGILPSKAALKAHAAQLPDSGDDPFHPERTLMVEEELPGSGMPRESMNSLRSRSSQHYPEQFANTEAAQSSVPAGHSKV